eukprot:887495_1
METQGNTIECDNNEIVKDDQNDDDSLYDPAEAITTPIGSITTKDGNVYENDNESNNDKNEEELYENYESNETPFTPIGNETAIGNTMGNDDAENNFVVDHNTNEGGM